MWLKKCGSIITTKIGKSWLVLDWCIKVAKGEPIWGMETTQGRVLTPPQSKKATLLQRAAILETSPKPATFLKADLSSEGYKKGFSFLKNPGFPNFYGANNPGSIKKQEKG